MEDVFTCFTVHVSFTALAPLRSMNKSSSHLARPYCEKLTLNPSLRITSDTDGSASNTGSRDRGAGGEAVRAASASARRWFDWLAAVDAASAIEATNGPRL
jgi:hypothetical protein